MTANSQSVLPRVLARTEEDARHALARDLSRICHEHGPLKVARAIGCDEKTIRNARDEHSSLKLHNAFNLLALDEGALDAVAAEYGFRLVRISAGSDDAHATADCARPLPKLALAQAPDSDGGAALTMRELYAMEEDIRASHRMTGGLIARIDASRGIGRAA